jgi:large subunit ribosomal protein L10
MTREEKNQLIDSLAEKLSNNDIIYLADIADLNSEDSTALRALCFKRDIKIQVVKNTLLQKAMEKSEKQFDDIYEALKGPTSLMTSDTGNAPAKLIKEFRKKSDKPVLKAAFIEDMVYLGDDQLDFLASIKSKNELIGDLIALLQSPMRNVLGALQSGGNKISGILETLSEKSE